MKATPHVHDCSTFECLHFYVCRDRDCRDVWTCPTCEDNEHFNDIQRLEIEQQAQLERQS